MPDQSVIVWLRLMIQHVTINASTHLTSHISLSLSPSLSLSLSLCFFLAKLATKCIDGCGALVERCHIIMSWFGSAWVVLLL